MATPVRAPARAVRPGFGQSRPTMAGRGEQFPGVDAWLLFLFLHVLLVTAIRTNTLLATFHALGTAAVGFHALCFKTPERIVYVLGYVAASEPIWRVARAMVFYETAKFLVAGFSILAILKFRLLGRANKAPLFYFLCLLPSLAVLPGFDRELISFNLSGPFALAMATLFFSCLRINALMLRKLFLVTMAPIFGLASGATLKTLTTEVSNFGTSRVASAGLGQNQASTIFGLGLLLAFFYLFVDRHNKQFRLLMAIAGVWCIIQAGLTFSRGGVATAIGAIGVASFLLLRDRHSRTSTFLRIGLLVVLAAYVVVPRLNAFTGGAFGNRFTSTDLTGRDRIMKSDLEAFKEHPMFGIGPGQSKDFHGRHMGRRYGTHTEYSRLLAEHGSFGIMAFLFLAWMSAKRLRRPSPVSAAMSAGFTAWTLLYMFHAAMRTAAASFVFALGAAYLMAEVPAAAKRVARSRSSRLAPLGQHCGLPSGPPHPADAFGTRRLPGPAPSSSTSVSRDRISHRPGHGTDTG